METKVGGHGAALWFPMAAYLGKLWTAIIGLLQRINYSGCKSSVVLFACEMVITHEGNVHLL